MARNLIVTSALGALVTSCTSPAPDDGGRAAEEAARQADLAAATPSPAPTVAQSDLPPCPGINPDIRRPPGSNCLGITPDRCAADKAQEYVGTKGTPEVRGELRQLASRTDNGNFRWIPHGTPVIQDLRPHRFNVELDRSGTITKIDCY